MRQVILQIDVTLDSFISGPNGERDWATTDEEMNQDALILLSKTDTILLGRLVYEQFVKYWPFADVSVPSTVGRIASQINYATKVVFSRTLDKVEWGQWNNARLVKGDVGQAISEMKSQPGKDLLLYGGADILSMFIQSGLVDEYQLRLYPVILGSGKNLFKEIHNMVDLNLVKTKSYQNGVVLLVYQPK